MFSYIWDTTDFLSFIISILKLRLIFRQINEPGRKQQKIPGNQNLSAELSTRSVEMFPIATCVLIIAAHGQNQTLMDD